MKYFNINNINSHLSEMTGVERKGTLKKSILLILILSLIGCAARVNTKQELLTAQEFSEKECYTYDTENQKHARAVKSGLFGIVGGTMAVIIDDLSLPYKCALTIDDATKEAYQMAYYDESEAILSQKKKDNRITITAIPTTKDENKCTTQKLVIKKHILQKRSQEYISYVEVCKDDSGIPVIVKDNADEQIFLKLKKIEVEKRRDAWKKRRSF